MGEDLKKRVHKRQVKRKYNFVRIAIGIALVIILGFLAFWGGLKFYEFLHPTKVAVTVPKDELLTDEIINKRINILILGVDDGDTDENGKFDNGPKRTDAMVVASVDPNSNEISLLSIPRDTYVHIPGKASGDKIAHAHVYGGVLLSKQTVANLLQIPIHYYVRMDWRGFIETVDLLGGVHLNVAHDMDYEDPYANLKIHIKKGYQLLDGQKAGEYVRFRHDELGDIGRVQRQQKFFSALASEFFTLKNIVKLPKIIKTVKSRIDTDMSTLTMFKVINTLKLFGDQKIKTEMLYGDFGDKNGISYWVTNPKKIEKTLSDLDIPHGKIQE